MVRLQAAPASEVALRRATFLISVRKVDTKESSECSPVAQSVERTAVNRQVAGSNPARGANSKTECDAFR
jgi:hypothetical protein